MSEGNILLQMTVIGNSVRVVAVHEETGTEVVFVAPRGTPMPVIQSTARKKVEYVLKKKNQD